MVDMVQDFLNSGNIDPRLNEVNICFIKSIFSETKTNTPYLVSETQYAFVSWRVISENIILAQKAFHALNMKEMWKKYFMVIETNMSKAYDKVE